MSGERGAPMKQTEEAYLPIVSSPEANIYKHFKEEQSVGSEGKKADKDLAG